VVFRYLLIFVIDSLFGLARLLLHLVGPALLLVFLGSLLLFVLVHLFIARVRPLVLVHLIFGLIGLIARQLPLLHHLVVFLRNLPFGLVQLLFGALAHPIAFHISLLFVLVHQFVARVRPLALSLGHSLCHSLSHSLSRRLNHNLCRACTEMVGRGYTEVIVACVVVGKFAIPNFVS
jgi:hypothetical protein